LPQITHLDVQVYSNSAPTLESKITILIKLHLTFTYSRDVPCYPASGLSEIWLRYAYFGAWRRFLKKFRSISAASASRRPFSTEIVWLRRASEGVSWRVPA